ncbi:MAG: aromatic ring-hydroxylating dioxygenase subunit alpha [Microbacteriaceae bacterium]
MSTYAGLVSTSAGTVSASIYVDEQIYRREMTHIFGRSWLFLCHESSISKPGDFITTSMGPDPVVVSRTRDGRIAAFLNQCRHRGMRICRADQGNAKSFTCTYHGWNYDNEGTLRQVPHFEDGYFSSLDLSHWGARPVPRIDNYRGLVFATWDPEAPSLLDWLGDMAWYLDSFINRWPRTEVAGPATRWIIGCNWKLPSEQFASDAYHAESSHISALMAQAPDQADSDDLRFDPSLAGAQFSSDLGHGTGFFLVEAPDMTNYGPEVEAYRRKSRDAEVERLGELRATVVRGHNTVFPNFSFLNGTNTLRVWHPRGPGRIEVMTWTLVDADAPAEVKDAMRKNAVRTFTASGIFEAEDGENWAEIQALLESGSMVRQTDFNVSMGLGQHSQDAHGLPGRISHMFSEEAARGFYRRWAQLMDEDLAGAR